MLIEIAFVQAVVFVFFFFLERLYPARQQTKAKNWDYWWFALNIYSLIWLKVVFYLWINWDYTGILQVSLNPLGQGFLFYLFYSFGNYWFHRIKHSNAFLWKVLHYLHHSPIHMETRVAFFRHPIEMLFNTLYLFALGKLVFGAPVEVIAVALAIEGCLECFHHANINTPRNLRWLAYIVQIPEMHLLHHQYGLHRYNYSPFLWDTVFGTAKTPEQWEKRLGFKNSNELGHLILLRYLFNKH